MKRLISGAAALILAAVLIFPAKVNALSAQKAILADAATGRILYEKDADSQSLIASTTKIMTALVVCEQCNVLDRMRIPKEAVGIEGSSMYLQEGEVLTVQELLYGLMLCSGNDAAVALAIYCGGTVEGFVERMNDKARVLGLDNTHFVNPNGLDSPGHYSTARDLAVLGAYAMKNPIFRKTVSTKEIKIGNRLLHNHNKLLWQYDGADGIKTGYTKAAGRILVSSAERDGRRLVAVTIHAPDDWNDHAKLLDQGFSQFQTVKIAGVGDVIGELQVVGGRNGTVKLIADEDFSYPLTSTESAELYIPGPGFLYAPITEGAEAGDVLVLVDGRKVGKIPVKYGATVELQPQKEKKRFFWQRFGGHE